jgi:DNA-binding NarL/FixJ family response regulator
MPIRVLLFDDNEERRRSLRYLMSMHPDVDLVADFPDCSTLSDALDEHLPDVVLMDIQMPGINGIEATKAIKERFPTMPVLMQTVFENEDLIFQAIKAGASGYLLKNERPDRIIEAIRELHHGGAPMSAIIAARVIQFFQHSVQPNNYDLTDREKEILKGLADGLSYKLIAGQLDISPHTVNSHIRNIYEKLHVHSLGEAIAKAIRERII